MEAEVTQVKPLSNYILVEVLSKENKTESGISCKAPFLADSHQFYINERCKIHSIKRISDNLIITVGDEVLSKTCNVPNKILSIELIDNKIKLYPRNSFYNLEDILKPKVVEPEFILPEKWCIKRTEETYKIINDYFKNKFSFNLPPIEKSSYIGDDINGWTTFVNKTNEITFDQFKKYVLKEEVKEETLLEKAKRLYPIGTKFKSVYSGNVFTIKNHIQESSNPTSIVFRTNEKNNGNLYYACVHMNDKWAEIIE